MHFTREWPHGVNPFDTIDTAALPAYPQVQLPPGFLVNPEKIKRIIDAAPEGKGCGRLPAKVQIDADAVDGTVQIPKRLALRTQNPEAGPLRQVHGAQCVPHADEQVRAGRCVEVEESPDAVEKEFSLRHPRDLSDLLVTFDAAPKPLDPTYRRKGGIENLLLGTDFQAE